MIATDVEGSSYRLQPSSTREFRVQYEAYRVRQARGLVRMLPRDVIRPLYRRAIVAERATEVGIADPLAVLLKYCETLLPLPPFEVWAEDASLNPVAHLHDLDDSADVPTAAAPATLERRLFDHAGQAWLADLRSFRDRGTWRGYISFLGRRSGEVHRTALIFRESGAADVRERFLSFESAVLEAFLRSALP